MSGATIGVTGWSLLVAGLVLLPLPGGSAYATPDQQMAASGDKREPHAEEAGRQDDHEHEKGEKDGHAHEEGEKDEHGHEEGNKDDHSHEDGKEDEHGHDKGRKDDHGHDEGERKTGGHKVGQKDDHGHGDGEKDEHGHDEHSAARLSLEKLQHAGVTFAVAEAGHVDDGVQLLGTVRPDGDRLAHITPRFAGIVRDVRASVGDVVEPGQILGVIESSESLAPYDLKTLIGGTIIEKHLTRGEAVDRDRQAFIVADLSRVWVHLSVYQKDLKRVAIGDRVHVRASQEDAMAEGTITYITPGVDDETRTATARVTLDNAARQWRPGMFVVAYALTPHPAEVVVPATAVQTLEGKSVVFVAEKDEVAPREVTLGHRGETVIEVLTGLKVGERVAATNTFLLKAELGKSEAEHSH
jgi:cobalt-zinc-cadmium efflux system membrane fusion protein